MKNEIAISGTQELITAKKYRIVECGMIFDEDIARPQWDEAGELLKKIKDTYLLCIGDWLNFGEAKWGEMYAQALPISGLSLGTLRNCKNVMGKVGLAMRKPNLTFSHYSLAAPLEENERKKILEKASDERWTVAKMREVLGDTIKQKEVLALTPLVKVCEKCGRRILNCILDESNDRIVLIFDDDTFELTGRDLDGEPIVSQGTAYASHDNWCDGGGS